MRLPILSTAAAAVVLLACTPGNNNRTPESGMADDDLARDTAALQDTASSGSPTGEGPPALSGMLSQLSLSNTAEIQTSELAVKQASSPAVRKVAKELVAAHTKNKGELETLAGSKDVDLLASGGGDTSRDTSGVLALKSLEGSEFDSAFVEGQIDAHRSNIDAIQNQMLPAATDAQVRQYLQKTQADMEKHLASLEKVQGELQS